jgi:hypothetical protein
MPSSSRVGMSQKSARNRWMKGCYSNSVTSDYLSGKFNAPKWEQLEESMYSTVAGIRQDGEHKFAFLSLSCKSPPHIQVDVSWCSPSPTTHVLCNSPHLLLLPLTFKHNVLMASLPATILQWQDRQISTNNKPWWTQIGNRKLKITNH